MRSPVLIAETPFAGGHGPRFLAPPGRQVDADTAAFYLANALEGDDDAEEIEGDDYLAVRQTLTDEATGDTAPQMLLLAGIDVDRMTGPERDEVLEQLRERLEVLNDAVLAVDWSAHGYEVVVEVPELDEWHEPGWDALPRAGRWADEHSAASTETTPTEPESSGDPRHDERDNTISLHEPSDAADESHAIESHVADVPTEPESTAHVEVHNEPPVIFELPIKHAPPPQSPVTVIVQVMTESAESENLSAASSIGVSAPKSHSASSPPRIEIKGEDQPSDPAPDLIVAAKEPIAPAPSSGSIDPLQVSASVDRSQALAPLPPSNESAHSPRRGLRWYVWFPWTALVVLIAAKYLYLTQVDRTWRQRITETHYAAGQTRVIEQVVEKPVDRVVEKIVEKPIDRVVERPIGVPIHVPVFMPIKVAEPVAADPKSQQWARFIAEYRVRNSQLDLIGEADMLVNWNKLLPASGPNVPEELKVEMVRYQRSAADRLRDWTNARIKERRFADVYVGLTAYAAAESVKALLGPAVPAEMAQRLRADTYASEDEYHYTQIRALAADPKVDERLKQHIDAYLSMVEPGGRMLGVVQQLADYRQWEKSGRPAKAFVSIDWGQRTPAREHTIEVIFGEISKIPQPDKTFTRVAQAEPGKTWSDTFAVTGMSMAGNGPFRIKTIRRATPVEEFAEADFSKTELFLSDSGGPPTVASDVDSGTKVRVDWQGIPVRPNLPEWGKLK